MKTQELIERKFWFKVRKGIFQVLLPGILGFYTLFGYAQDSDSGTYSHLYFYTALLLMTQTFFRHFAEYLFDLCSVSVIAGDIELARQANSRLINIIRVFKTKYSTSGYLEKIVQLCGLLGIETPIFIPRQVVEAFGEEAENRTDEEIVGSTIDFIQSYRPVVYQMVSLGMESPSVREEVTDRPQHHERAPKRIITSLDASIGDLQFEIFGERSVIEEASVLDQV